MIFAILGVVLICFICSLMNKSSNQEARSEELHAEQQRILQQQAVDHERAQKARRIEAFQALLKEEFPHMADMFTYSAVAGFEGAFFAAENDDFVKVRKKAFSKTKYKTDEDRHTAYTYMISKGIYSFPEPIRVELSKDKDFVGKVIRAFTASRDRVG